MRTQVYGYNGYVGIICSPEAEGLINSVLTGCLYSVVDLRYVDATPEAVELLRQIPKQDEGTFEFPTIDITDNPDNPGQWVLAWFGGMFKGAMEVADSTVLSEFDPSRLNVVETMEVPQDLKDYIDGLIAGKEQKAA